MIEIEIPKDLRDYEPKQLGPFTTRQAIGVGLATVTMLIGFFTLKNIFDNGLNVIIPMGLASIFILFGYWKPYGMPFEKYVISQIVTVIIPPKKRKYKIDNLYAQFDKELEKEELEKLKEIERQNKIASKGGKK